MHRHPVFAVLALAIALGGSPALGGENQPSPVNSTKPKQAVVEWPHFLGPNFNNVSTEKGLLKAWPTAGPRLLWKYEECGAGQSAVSVADGLVFTAGDFESDCMVLALDKNGALKWKSKNGKAWDGAQPGSRATPTYNDGMVYHLNAHGTLGAFDAQTGAPVWSVDLYEKYGLERHTQFGYAESLAVVDDKVIVMPGGKQGFVVALEKKKGGVLWECPRSPSANPSWLDFDRVSYCTPSVAEINGSKQILYLTEFSVMGVDVNTGKSLWRERHFPNAKHLSVLTVNPLFVNGMIFITTPYDEGSKAYKLNADGAGLTEVWADKKLDNEHGGVVVIDGYIYGCGGYEYPMSGWVQNEVSRGVLYCLELATGKQMWTKPLGRCAITAADGMLYCRHELGTVFLIEASPKACNVISQLKMPVNIRSPSLNHPVVAGGRLYVRSINSLFVYDLKQ